MRITKKYIIHVDMDAFFASCEQEDNPSLKGKPVIVGADPKNGKGRGVVSACSYEARKFGIHSAMPISRAYKKCPHGVFLPVNGKRYSEVSRKIFALFQDFTPDVEPVSIDEAFLDITGSHQHFGGPEETCRRIKNSVNKNTGLTASVGLAPNKMTAKIASDLKKPDGLVIVREENLTDFLAPLPVGKLWGVGEKTKKCLHKIGIRTIGDIASSEPHTLIYFFGRNGQHLWELASGIDERNVETEREALSISNEHTYEKDTANIHYIRDVIMALSEKTAWRMRKHGLKARTITLKIRFSDFRTCTRAATIDKPTNFAHIIYENCIDKLREFTPLEKNNKKLRLLGVKVSNFSEDEQEQDLFFSPSLLESRKEDLYIAMDRIKDKFGENAIRLRRPG
jgi:nucleotidyltransferase/DNA polymerase involved in DNA repair